MKSAIELTFQHSRDNRQEYFNFLCPTHISHKHSGDLRNFREIYDPEIGVGK